MILRNEAEIHDFWMTLDECVGPVYLVNPEGKALNIQPVIERYIGLGRLLDKDGDDLEFFADRKEDEYRLISLFWRLQDEKATA